MIPSIGPLRGGLSFAVLDMCRGLANAGVDVTLATTDDNGRAHLDIPLGVPLKRDGYCTWCFPRQTLHYCLSWPLTRWLIQNIRGFDCVHIHGVFSDPTVSAAALAFLNHVPYVLTPHGILMDWGREHRRPKLKRVSLVLIEGNILRAAAILHLTSEQEQHEIPAAMADLPSITVPLGIDLKPFEYLPPPGWLRSHYPKRDIGKLRGEW